MILQPMTKQVEVRDFLIANHFQIMDEVLSEDDGKIYQTICAEYRETADETYGLVERLVGRHNIARGGELLERFVRHRIEVLTVVRDGKRLSGHPSEEDEKNVEVLCALLKEIQEK